MSQTTSDDVLDEDFFFSEMLSSQSDLENQIKSLKETTNSDRSAEEKLEDLQKFLSSSNIQSATVDILDEKIFSAVLSDARKIYFQIICNINNTLENKENICTNRIKSQLNVLANLLKCWDSCMNHIRNLEKLSILDIKNFTSSLFEIIFEVLNHCKKSEKYYGDHFKTVAENLALTFRQCGTTLSYFYALVDSNVSFDASQEDEMRVLLSIIDESGKIASLTSGMDAKTLTDMWKRFGKLSTSYGLQMKDISPNVVTNHFKGLSENIVDMLSSIGQKIHRPSNERSILCCRVLFKVLEKLCETYCGWVRNDVMLSIVDLLSQIYQYSEQRFAIAGHNADFIKFVRTNFVFMIDSFLNVVMKNDSFKVVYFEYNQIVTDNVVGYHLLTLTIIKQISMLPYETQREWCSEDSNITDICFANIDKLTQEICTGQVQVEMSRNLAQGSYQADIYEATCLSIFSLVCQVPSSDVDEFMELLLKYLISGKWFSSLLSCDVWCFICRLGSSELCYSHFKYLMLVYEKLEDRKNHVNTVMLSNLLSRQYTFLSDKDKHDFISGIKKNSSSHGWDSIAQVVNEEKRKLLQLQVDAFDANNRIANDLKILEEQPNLDNLCSLMNDLAIIEATGTPQDGQSADTFIKTWNKIVCILGDCEGVSLSVIENLAVSLLHATRPQLGQARYTTLILERLVLLYPFATSGLRLEFCWFFDRCAVHLTESDSMVASELFCRLLSDSEPCVQQQAFESFERLTHVCSDTKLLSSIATNIRDARAEASKTLPAYISAEVAHRFHGFSSFNGYFRALGGAFDARRHVCRERGRTIEREEKLPRLDGAANDSRSGPVDVEKVVERVCDDVNELIKFKGQLNGRSRDRLRQVLRGFLDQSDC
ncbi:uncharacterized protein C1orf112 homolog [Copidosoma floridanum]|uniref:uncharacterized protein C1orf112 homolog n=1 Tax=Copidosoma floridanum TaxID=29053 RepID=UPI0006C9B0B7|nr:uncharacterized protein C1orf112 homolog [Copidosoma floridanum]